MIRNYHDIFGSFPSGYVYPSGFATNSAAANRESWGWAALTLAFREQQALHEQLGVTSHPLYRGFTAGGTAFKDFVQSPTRLLCRAACDKL